MEHVIEVENLRKIFKQSHEALKGISFGVKRGEIFGLLGPNGAGKTTTIEILQGLKDATSGTVKMFGLDAELNRQKIKERIGVQLQSSEYFGAVTLSELVHLFASFYHKKHNPKQLLQLVNLEDKAESEVRDLSGGQKHRFALASALVNDPEILFLDEPTTGLDPRVRRELWELIKSLNAKGVTIFLTTHYMEEAEFLCDRVGIIDNGSILTIDEPRNLIAKLDHTNQVSFFVEGSFDDSWLKQIPEIKKCYRHDPKIILDINDLTAIEKILAELRNRKIDFTSFTVRTATLEDVYLNLTGKEIVDVA